MIKQYNFMPSNFVYMSTYFVLSKRAYPIAFRLLSGLTYMSSQSMETRVSRRKHLLIPRFVSCLQWSNKRRLNSRRFVRGKGTDREEVTGPTFLMVGNPFSRSRQNDDKHNVTPFFSLLRFIPLLTLTQEGCTRGRRTPRGVGPLRRGGKCSTAHLRSCDLI